MSTEPIEAAYNRPQLFEAILQALEKAGLPAAAITPKDIAAVDEFHVRGQKATKELAAQANLQAGMEVLDIGCGLGGAARLLASTYDCHVTGIDITREYIRTANLLSELTGLHQQTTFMHGSALLLPFADKSFDCVWTQHVQMNIADKKTFYAQARRVLRPGGHFVYYDVLRKGIGPIQFPVPWASDASLSHLVNSSGMRKLLSEAGLQPREVTDQTEAGIQFLSKVLQQPGLPLISIQLLLGDSTMQRLENLYDNLTNGHIMLESGIYQRLTKQ